MLGLPAVSDSQHEDPDLPSHTGRGQRGIGFRETFLLLLLFSLLPPQVSGLSWSGRTPSPVLACPWRPLASRGEGQESHLISTCSCCPWLPETLCSFTGGESGTLLPKMWDREFLMVLHITLSRLFTEHIYNFFVPHKKADGFADINIKLLGTKMQLMHF